ncbi:MAG: sulfate ABC transporter ATP-binding protein [Candidatus Omnitrophota bacterium]
MSIEVHQVVKKFGNFTALKGISLKIETGELLALLGPSGSGKTTLLRVIAGLEEATGGQVFFLGDDVSSRKVQDRGVGFVFQHYALFRHMTVFDNIAFGLRVRPRDLRPSEEEIAEKVHELLRLVRLDGMATRFPSQLSGGQRQRVALARALAIEPKVLLLDEPFGSLDSKVRKELRQWLRSLHDRLHMTTIFVTHDQEEALEVADRVVVMNEGRIEQMGTPDEVYHKPVNSFVYNFLGNVNLFHCRLEGGKAYIANTPVSIKTGVGPEAQKAKIYIRPHLLEISHEKKDDSFKGVVQFLNSAGAVAKVEVLSEWGEAIQVEVPQERFRILNLQKGEEIYVILKDAKLFNEDYMI